MPRQLHHIAFIRTTLCLSVMMFIGTYMRLRRVHYEQKLFLFIVVRVIIITIIIILLYRLLL